MNDTPKSAQRFSSRWAMILTCMGMAVGTGNIWRFPREVAKHGGGSFLIPWILFLFLWSIPLLMTELSIGRKTRRGPFNAFAHVLGPRWAPLGGFISVCAIMILCYYAVVTGWTFKYLFYAVGGSLNQITSDQALALFDHFRSTPQALLFHVLAIGVAAFFVFRGAHGIETLNKVLIPCLALILVYGAVRSLILDGAGAGLTYLFTVEPHRLADPAHWIAGLTQSAWSTGAGWGLMLSYAVYARKKDDPVTTPVATGLGNNTIELLVGMMIFPAVFAIVGDRAVAFIASAGWKGGIAFQSVPLLFQEMAGGPMLNILFFLGLAFAALTSLVSLIELSTRFFQDFGMSRNRSLAFTITVCLVLGAPSALNDAFFDNQDFVWGVGLIVSGLWLALFVLRYGGVRFFVDFVRQRPGHEILGRIFQGAMVLVVVEALVLLVWFLAQSGGTLALHCLGQWGVVVILLALFSKGLTSRMEAQTSTENDAPP